MNISLNDSVTKADVWSSHLDQDAKDKQPVVLIGLRSCFRVSVLPAVPVDEVQLEIKVEPQLRNLLIDARAVSYFGSIGKSVNQMLRSTLTSVSPVHVEL